MYNFGNFLVMHLNILDRKMYSVESEKISFSKTYLAYEIIIRCKPTVSSGASANLQYRQVQVQTYSTVMYIKYTVHVCEHAHGCS